jgi:CheY-like chemotaxis protein
MRVLLIDDEPMVRKIVRKMLERAGHAVVDVENGRAGLHQLEKVTFDLIVTDIIMPDVEGIEVLMTVREQHPLHRCCRHVRRRPCGQCRLPGCCKEARRRGHFAKAVYV